MKQVVPALLLLPLMLLTGCDPISGYRRSARVDFVPDPSRVGSIIQSTPGVERVEYWSPQSGRVQTFVGVKPASDICEFLYSGGSNVHGILQFTVDSKGGVKYEQSLMLRQWRPPSREWIDATCPVMIHIEKELAEQCGLTNLPTSVVEECIRMKCK